MRPVEVSIFGTGRGEAIAVHLGDGNWITVDSCRHGQAHPVLDYLEREGVDVGSDVKLVVATHAHDDHVAGISDLYSAAKAAIFVCAAALTRTEFLALVETDEQMNRQIRKRVRAEYAGVFDEIERRRGLAATGLRPQINAVEQLSLWPTRPSEQVATVLALSPSSQAFHRATQRLAQACATSGAQKRLPSEEPNELAVALWIQVGSAVMLLGADLENGPAGCGWTAVLSSHVPESRASLYKVAHHGSINAHNPDLWSQLLEPDVVSLLAPFVAGSVSLPTSMDIQRIKSHSGSAHIAVAPKELRRQRHDVGKVAANLMTIARNVREPNGLCGHVRAQWNSDAGEWDIKLFRPAVTL